MRIAWLFAPSTRRASLPWSSRSIWPKGVFSQVGSKSRKRLRLLRVMMLYIARGW